MLREKFRVRGFWFLIPEIQAIEHLYFLIDTWNN
jgi:hypothetical protein